jgi:hypothetical protein
MGRTTKQKPKKVIRKTVVKYEKCAICINTLQTRTVANIACVHQYCFKCIKQWSETRNTCPQCMVQFHEISKVHGDEVYTVPREEYDDMDNSFGMYSQLLHLFFTCRLFRCRIEMGVVQCQRAPIAIFLILVDIVEQLRRHELLPPSVDSRTYHEAHRWMRRVDGILGGARLVTVERPP